MADEIPRTYLELVQSLSDELDWSYQPPATVDGLEGDLRLLPKWIGQAHVNIQTERAWRWMRREWELTLVADKGTYAYADVQDREAEAAIDRFSKWVVDDEDPVRGFREGRAESNITLTWLDWEDFRYQSDFGIAATAQPFYITIDPQDRLRVLGVPNEDAVTAGQVLRGEYDRGPQVLVDDGDEPEMPWQHRQIIVWLAMVRYGYSRAAPEALAQAQFEYTRMHKALLRTQNLQIDLAEPLA